MTADAATYPGETSSSAPCMEGRKYQYTLVLVGLQDPNILGLGTVYPYPGIRDALVVLGTMVTFPAYICQDCRRAIQSWQSWLHLPESARAALENVSPGV